MGCSVKQYPGIARAAADGLDKSCATVSGGESLGARHPAARPLGRPVMLLRGSGKASDGEDRLCSVDIDDVFLAGNEYDDWLDPTSCLSDDEWLQIKSEPRDG